MQVGDQVQLVRFHARTAEFQKRLDALKLEPSLIIAGIRTVKRFPDVGLDINSEHTQLITFETKGGPVEVPSSCVEPCVWEWQYMINCIAYRVTVDCKHLFKREQDHENDTIYFHYRPANKVPRGDGFVYICRYYDETDEQYVAGLNLVHTSYLRPIRTINHVPLEQIQFGDKVVSCIGNPGVITRVDRLLDGRSLGSIDIEWESGNRTRSAPYELSDCPWLTKVEYIGTL